MIKFIVCVGLGFVGHFLSPTFDKLEMRLNGNGTAWTRIGRYAVGGIMIQLSTRVMLRGVSHPSPDEISGAISSGMIATGAGVCAGYVLDVVIEK